ncbi:uncharacterized protein [Lepeophtheirus salmonis]|uniref:uncharacterized protein n=1 Tax=Lepeophtheirus salmonis TaxID=72036 RepID=UPI001AE9F1C9|nr:uncharacterized protein LOC121119398 [Lepeophtheirus salmonis]
MMTSLIPLHLRVFLFICIITTTLISFVECRPKMRSALRTCPLEDGNLLDVLLFVNNENECYEECADHESCLFYHYYKSNDEEKGQHSQCFLYDACTRHVHPAKSGCPINKENTVKVEVFIKDEEVCRTSCSESPMCGYYLYNGEAKERFCYHLKSCVPRVVLHYECPLLKSNYIDHYLFTASEEKCRERCDENGECRYYYWYPIDYSPSPLYCYLFRSCEGATQEHRVGFVTGGRHPGHYFLNEESSTEIVKSGAVCKKTSNDTSMGRAGAVADYVSEGILLCGGRDLNSQVKKDCRLYGVVSGLWSDHSELNFPREEAASATLMDKNMYILGGIIEDERTGIIEKLSNGSWVEESARLPEPRSRFCAVALDSANVIAILGGETGDEEETLATRDMKIYNTETGDWTNQPDMPIGRKDHACVVADFKGNTGILVSGGVGPNKQLINTVDFYSFNSESWMSLAPMQQARTEHGMAVVGGLPMVMGGVAENEFLSSIEVLDFSDDEEKAVLGRLWRFNAEGLSSPRYDFGVAAVPLESLSKPQQNMNTCKNMGDETEDRAMALE